MVTNTMKEVDNKIYYWFINQAYSSPCLMSLVTYYERYDSDLQMKPECPLMNLGIDEAAKILSELFKNGFLLAILAVDKNKIEDDYAASRYGISIDDFMAKSFVPSIKEILKNLEVNNESICNSDEVLYSDLFDNGFYYFLTEKGAKLWESVFKPKWSWYLGRGGNREVGIIYCADIDIGKKLISVDDLLSIGRENTISSIEETQICETIIPWQVTYWKQLSIGYKITFKQQLVSKDSITLNRELNDRIKQADEWLKYISNWHDNEYFNEWFYI
jgi:hypothetical protein